MYILAIIFPPLAVLLTAGFGSACLNFLLTLCVWIPGVIHALIVVSDHKANQRNNKLIAAVTKSRP